MSQEKRHYVGSGKRVKEYDLINITLCMTDVPKEAVYEYKGKRYLSLTLGGKKAVDQYGKTHSLWLNEFSKDKKMENKNEDNSSELNNYGTKVEYVADAEEATDTSDFPF